MWRFHKDMREKDQGGNSTSTSGVKTDNGSDANNQTMNNDTVDPYSLLDIKSGPSLLATSLSGGGVSKASSPTSKSEAVIDSPQVVSSNVLELANAKSKNQDKENVSAKE